MRCHLSNRLRAKFDSADVVQSVWVHVLRGLGQTGWRFREQADLQAFLVTVARRRLISRYRHYRTALERELPGAEMELVPAQRQPRPQPVAPVGAAIGVRHDGQFISPCAVRECRSHEAVQGGQRRLLAFRIRSSRHARQS